MGNFEVFETFTQDWLKRDFKEFGEMSSVVVVWGGSVKQSWGSTVSIPQTSARKQ